MGSPGRLLIVLVLSGSLWFTHGPDREALAHEQNEAYTTVLFNERTGNLEVSHRFSAHDAEHALQRLFGKEADILQSALTRKKFAAYVKRNFQLRNDANQLLLLSDVGCEIEGKFIWVYQEMPIPESLRSLGIKMQALQDVLPGQTNQVNVEKEGVIRSVRLDKTDDWKSVELSSSTCESCKNNSRHQ